MGVMSVSAMRIVYVIIAFYGKNPLENAIQEGGPWCAGWPIGRSIVDKVTGIVWDWLLGVLLGLAVWHLEGYPGVVVVDEYRQGLERPMETGDDGESVSARALIDED
jgi:hypothetical protein